MQGFHNLRIHLTKERNGWSNKMAEVAVSLLKAWMGPMSGLPAKPNRVQFSSCGFGDKSIMVGDTYVVRVTTKAWRGPVSECSELLTKGIQPKIRNLYPLNMSQIKDSFYFQAFRN